MRPSQVGVQSETVSGAFLESDDASLIVRESQRGVPDHGVVALEIRRQGRPSPERCPRAARAGPSTINVLKKSIDILVSYVARPLGSFICQDGVRAVRKAGAVGGTLKSILKKGLWRNRRLAGVIGLPESGISL